MALKAIVDTLDGLPEDVAKEYEDKGGKFILIVEDDIRQHPKVKALQVAFERGKDKVKELTDKLAEIEEKLALYPAEFDPDKFAADMDELAALRTKKKKGDDGPDPEHLAQQKKLFEQRITALEKKHGEERAALEKERDTLVAEIERLVADDGLTKALVDVGVEKKLLPGATALLRKSVKVKRTDTGEWLGYFDSDLGETPIKDYVSNWAQSDEGTIYIAKAKGGDGKGGDGNKGAAGDNPFDASNGKKPNLFQQQELIKKNPERARQLAQAAGVTPNW